MSHFNLPPGVSVNDIPGNRPEDVAEEKFWEEVDAKFAETMPNYAEVITILESTTGLGMASYLLDSKNMLMEEVIHGYATVAREIAYKLGFDDGVGEAALRAEDHDELTLYRQQMARFKEAGWAIADDGDPYKPEETVHEVHIIRTKAIVGEGTFYQAECSCGWLAPLGRPDEAAAMRDFEGHA